jgi:hypothetical protein
MIAMPHSQRAVAMKRKSEVQLPADNTLEMPELIYLLEQ